MIHVRVDDAEPNEEARFACGIRGVKNLPLGDKYFFQTESAASRADCPGCNPDGPKEYGTPISELTGGEFRRIGRSWGYD